MNVTVVDHDAVVLEDLGETVIAIDVKYRRASPGERLALKADRDAALEEYGRARDALLADGVICDATHVAEMRQIKAEIHQAAERQQLLRAFARVIGFMRGLA
jgi:hypothetical protein